MFYNTFYNLIDIINVLMQIIHPPFFKLFISQVPRTYVRIINNSPIHTEHNCCKSLGIYLPSLLQNNNFFVVN